MRRPLVTGFVRFRLRPEARRDFVTRALAVRLEELGCNVTSLSEDQLTFQSCRNPQDEEFEFLRRASSGEVRLVDRKPDLLVRFRLIERSLLSFVAVALIPVAWALSDLLRRDIILTWLLLLMALLLLMFVTPSESKKAFGAMIKSTVDDVTGIDPRQDVS